MPTPLLLAMLLGLLNLGCLAGLTLAWRWEQRRRPALASPPCPGPLTYATGKLGDTLGLTAIVGSVAWAWAERPWPASWLGLCPLLALGICWGYVAYCRRARLRDWTFQQGRLTRSGWLHQGYVFLGVTVAAAGLGRLATVGLTWPLGVALAGGALYLLCLLADVRSGRRGVGG